jgi:hypothetical protein
MGGPDEEFAHRGPPADGRAPADQFVRATNALTRPGSELHEYESNRAGLDRPGALIRN